MVTLGNHTWDNRSIFDFIDDADKLVRPANFPESNPGKGLTFVLSLIHTKWLLFRIEGRTFMPMINCPFEKVEQLVEEAKKRTNIIFVDFHAEATSEKVAMGIFLRWTC